MWWSIMTSIRMHIAVLVIFILWHIGLISIVEYQYKHDNNRGGIALLLFFLGTCAAIFIFGGK